MKILVTGAKGFIGAHVARRLAKSGHEVYGMDNGYTATEKEIKGVKLIEGDINVPADFTKFPVVETVVHCAGILGTHEIAEMDLINKANTVNINGTVNVLDYCKKVGAKHVFATKPNPEDWCNPYTITKLAAENYCIMYAREYGVQTTALSLAWVYGKEQRQEPVNKFVPTFMKYALTGEDLPIFNGGKQVIDCCYMDDDTEAFHRAVEYELEPRYVKIDVGTGTPITINEVAETIIRVTGSKSKLKDTGKRLGEPIGSAIVADTALAKKYLDFVPKTQFEEGISLCVEWFKEKYDKKRNTKKVE